MIGIFILLAIAAYTMIYVGITGNSFGVTFASAFAQNKKKG